MAQLAHEAGVPAGGGKEVGEPLGLHPDVDMVSFTGSTETGRRFLRYAADSNLKRIVLECGGKNPAVVLRDAQDLDTVAQHVANGAFWNMGENCSASSRLIAHADVKDALLQRIGVHMREWKMDNPLDPEHRIGAMVSKAHFETPFGGYKQSGFGGRDKSVWAHDQYTEMKTIWIDVPASAA